MNPSNKVEARCKEAGIKVIAMPTNMRSDEGTFKCVCKSIFEATGHYIMKHARCPPCVKARAIAAMKEKRKLQPPTKVVTHAEFVIRLREANPNIVCASRYKYAVQKMKFRCLVCNDIREAFPANAVRFGCPNCAGRKTKNVRIYNTELRAKGIHFKAYEYKGAREKVLHQCTRCKKYEVSMPPTNMLREAKARCPICDSNTVYEVQSGSRVFRVRGFERFALPKMLRVYKPSEVFEDLSGKVPVVLHRDGRRHLPDFYIPKHNLLIEIKSMGTLGITRIYGRSNLAKCRQNKMRAIELGYRYKLVLMEGKRIIKLPTDWETYSKRDLVAHIRSLGFKC